jgi:hypothetical protein
VEEWREAAWLAAAYPPAHNGAAPAADTLRTGVGRKLSTASSLLKKGPALFSRVARERARSAGHSARAWTVGQIVKRREPFVPALRAGRCPDCGAPLAKESVCASCGVAWMLA